MQKVDHVIIGTGINALVAGALLSRKGKRVLMLERESHVGGCMITTEATVPGFRHDVMAATFVLFITSPAYAELAGDLAQHGLDFCHTPHPTAVLRPDGRATVFTTDRAANVAAFNALAPGDGDQHARDVGRIETDAGFLFALLGGDLWSAKTARLLAGQAWKRGLNGLKAWIGEALVPARGWLETSYDSDDIRALWAPWVLHCGLTPESTYSGEMAKVVAFALEAAGAPIVKGGTARAAEAFRSLIEANGGEIRTGTDVDRILVEGGRATGVETANGDRIAADHVLASVTPGQLYGRLLRDHTSAEDSQTARRFRHGRGDFQLHFALDRHPEWLTDGLDDVALIHLSDGIDAVSKSSNEAERGMLPATPTICVGQPHRLDPGRCPEGKAILWLQIPDAPRVIKGDAKGEIETSGQWDEATREAFADRLEAILATHIHDFDKIKLARRAYSPADLEALNMNLVGGDPYGGLCTIDQFFVFRPFAGSRNGATPVKGLTQIGASTHPGPGMGGGSGYNAAKRLGA
ncbi:phytoene desaturase family protein [Pseudodonghicola flavimaris]|uniref:NAD(P)/FAD-dependent oxidoreductase n=1 Tax=Pseudodonghicola flavimaris TaxID=3050036 RepID=A0ABT7EY56_9RHOB|nr:NAD(P)/FAD-dependent oxidoreductase [Pseudodonghicola flavimaris]MDK3017276.1 NAD(P)/FAD-dependent oxidoreductase [Pseudodonghicola flavimaris]